jgi:hypothetical protein
MVVRPRYLFRFIAWQLRRTPRPLAKLRRLVAMAAAARPGAKSVDPSRLRYFEDRPGASWMQYSSDGSRMLIVDLPRREALRFQLKVDSPLVERELTIRDRAGGAAPPVLSHDASAGMLVERWMQLRPAPERPSTLDRAMRLLMSTVYAPTSVTVDEYLDELKSLVRVERLRARLTGVGLATVTVSDVHGDLWPGNIAIDETGALVLLDWEYARRCLHTHDLWTFLMQARRQRGQPFDDEFLRDFAAHHHVFFGSPIDERLARVHHLLHLIERYSLFVQLDLPHKTEEMTFLRGQIAAHDPELPV